MQCKKSTFRKLINLKMQLLWSHFSLHMVFCTLMWNAAPSQSQIHCFPAADYPLSRGFLPKSLQIYWTLLHQLIWEGREAADKKLADLKDQHAICWATSSQHRTEPKASLVSNGISWSTYRFDSRRDSFPKISCIIPKKIKLKILLSNQIFATRRHQRFLEMLSLTQSQCFKIFPLCLLK